MTSIGSAVSNPAAAHGSNWGAACWQLGDWHCWQVTYQAQQAQSLTLCEQHLPDQYTGLIGIAKAWQDQLLVCLQPPAQQLAASQDLALSHSGTGRHDNDVHGKLSARSLMAGWSQTV